MPEEFEVDSQLANLVERIETVVLIEASSPRSLERITLQNSPMIRERTSEELVLIARASCIALGHLVVIAQMSVADVVDVVTSFAASDLKGLSRLGSFVPPHLSQLTLWRTAQFSEFFAEPFAVRLDGLLQHEVLSTELRYVTWSLAAVVGKMVRANRWTADDAAQIIRSTHNGITEGIAERARR